MVIPKTVPRVPQPPSEIPEAAPKKLGKIEPSTAGDRVILYSQGGWGKTTLACHAPNMGLIMAEGETGYQTLRKTNKVPNVDATVVSSWPELLATVRAIKPGEYGLLAFDAMSGFEKLCHQFVCARDFGNDWSTEGKGFLAYGGKGAGGSMRDWALFLTALDRIRGGGTNILILSHAKISPGKDIREGVEYKMFTGDSFPVTFTATMNWADEVLFGTFDVKVAHAKVKDGVTSGIGIGKDRVIYSEYRNSYHAKDRLGLPPCIDMGDDAAQMYNILAELAGWPTNSSEDSPPEV